MELKELNKKKFVIFLNEIMEFELAGVLLLHPQSQWL